MLACDASTGVVCCGAGDAVVLARGAGPAQVLRVPGDASPVVAVALSRCGAYCVAASQSKAVRCWRVATGALISAASVPRRPTALTTASFEDEAAAVVACAGDVFALPVPRLDSVAEPRFCLGHTSSMVLSMAFAPGCLATCDRNEKLRLNRWPRTELIEAFGLGHDDFVSRVAFAARGDDEVLVVSAGGDATVRTWDLKGTEVAQGALDAPAACLAVSAATVAVATSTQTIRVFDDVSALATHRDVAHHGGGGGEEEAAPVVVDLAFVAASTLLVYVADAKRCLLECALPADASAPPILRSASSPAAAAVAAAIRDNPGLEPPPSAFASCALPGEDATTIPHSLKKHALDHKFDTDALEPHKRPRTAKDASTTEEQ